MPDWDIELTHTLGRGNVATHLVTIEDVSQQGVAQIAGIEECLQWDAVPEAARAYWRKAKMEGAMPYEVLTELESNWNLTFTCKEHIDIPVVAIQPEARSNGRPTPTVPQDRASNLSLLDSLKQRYAEVIQERKRLDEEFEILSRLFGKPKRKYERKSGPTKSKHIRAAASASRNRGRKRAKITRGIRRTAETMDRTSAAGNEPEAAL